MSLMFSVRDFKRSAVKLRKGKPGMILGWAPRRKDGPPGERFWVVCPEIKAEVGNYKVQIFKT